MEPNHSSTSSPAGLKTVTELVSSSPKVEEKTSEVGKQMDVCLQCATKYHQSANVLLLNSCLADEQQMFTAMMLRRASEPSKKSKKHKGAPADSTSDPTAPSSKSKKPNTNGDGNGGQPHTNPSISAASHAVISSLAMEEAKRKGGMSDAVKSLCSKEGEKRKETFMTMGTFTRVSAYVLFGHNVMLILGVFVAVCVRAARVVAERRIRCPLLSSS
jgi:hypothetical protein